MERPSSIHISIPEPCHEDWNNMTPQEQGKFCGSCKKCVVDFTGFSDEELYRFIAGHKGQKICGRFRSTQLNRQISIPHQPHSVLYTWMMAAGLALVFVAAPEMKGFAQAPVQQENHRNIDRDQQLNVNAEVSGTVLDHNNEPLINALVEVSQRGKVRGTTLTDFDGNFVVKPLEPGKYILKAKFLGYKDITLKVGTTRQVIVKFVERIDVSGLVEISDNRLIGLIDVSTQYQPLPLDSLLGRQTITNETIEKK